MSRNFLYCLVLLLCSLGNLVAQRTVIIPLIDAKTKGAPNVEDGYRSVITDADGLGLTSIPAALFTRGQEPNKQVYLECRVPKAGRYVVYFLINGYENTQLAFEIEKKDKRKNIELEKFLLTPLSGEESKNLDAVTVTAPKVKFYFDQDTLIYSANGYQSQAGAMLSNILQKMPGLEIKPDGEIFSNGKRINVLLLNGKDFFNEDRLTILGNLPAYAVKQVKVYETQNEEQSGATERERMRSGRIMDILLKPDFQSAHFANLDLGAGTKERYYAKLFGLIYGTHYRLSGYAMSNNINRNETLQLDGTAQNMDNGIGEKRHHKMGVNYNYDDYKSRFTLRGMAELLWAGTDADSRQSTQSFFPAGDIFRTSNTDSRLRDFAFQTSHELNPFANNKYSFVIKPQFSYMRNRQEVQNLLSTSRADATQLSTNWLDSLWQTPYSEFFQLYGINRQSQIRKYTGEVTNAGVNLFKSKITLAEDKSLSLSASWNYYHHDNADHLHRLVDYVATPAANSWQNQHMNEVATRHNAEGALHYIWAITQRSSFSAGYTASSVYYDTNHSLFALDALNGWRRQDSPVLGMLPSQRDMLSVLDHQNSYTYTERQQIHKVAFGYAYALFGGAIGVTLPFNIESKRLDFSQSNRTDQVKRTFYMPEVKLQFSRRNMKGLYMMVNYDFQQKSPTLYNLIELENTSNPLFITRGNPSLRPEQIHNISAQYFVPKGMGYHSVYISGVFRQNAVAQSPAYEATSGRTIITPRNVDGNYTLGLNLKNKVFLTQSSVSSLENDFGLDFARSVDYISLATQVDPYLSKVYHSTIKEKLTYEQSLLKHRLRLSFSAYCNYNRYTSAREGFETVNSFDYGGKFVINAELPGPISLSTDLTSVSRRGYNYSVMNSDEYLWNARLTKSFGERIQLQFEVSDILAQRKGVYHMLNAQSRVEEVYNVLGRYGMLHFIWRLGKQPRQGHHRQ